MKGFVPGFSNPNSRSREAESFRSEHGSLNQEIVLVPRRGLFLVRRFPRTLVVLQAKSVAPEEEFVAVAQQQWITVFGSAGFAGPAFAFAQPPTNSSSGATGTSPAAPPTSAESSNKKKSSSRHQHDFLIKGTVFTPEGLSFAGARIRIRKAGDKSFSLARRCQFPWRICDSRGARRAV